MELVTVEPLNKVGEDERGATYDFSLSPRPDFILIERKKGTMSGGFYHKGVSDTVNPKVFVLLKGKIRFSYREISQDQHTDLITDQPSLIKVVPNVTHCIECLEDSMFLECNSIADISNDRYKESIF